MNDKTITVRDHMAFVRETRLFEKVCECHSDLMKSQDALRHANDQYRMYYVSLHGEAPRFCESMDFIAKVQTPPVYPLTAEQAAKEYYEKHRDQMAEPVEMKVPRPGETIGKPQDVASAVPVAAENEHLGEHDFVLHAYTRHGDIIRENMMEAPFADRREALEVAALIVQQELVRLKYERKKPFKDDGIHLKPQ